MTHGALCGASGRLTITWRTIEPAHAVAVDVVADNGLYQEVADGPDFSIDE
jgi:two-component sensor histidine kinase